MTWSSIQCYSIFVSQFQPDSNTCRVQRQNLTNVSKHGKVKNNASTFNTAMYGHRKPNSEDMFNIGMSEQEDLPFTFGTDNCFT